MLMPVALIAVISLDRCIRPSVTSTASRMLRCRTLYRKKGATFSRYSPTTSGEIRLRRMSPSNSNKREHLQQHEERRHDHGEIDKKIPQDVIVQNHGKAGAEHAAPVDRALEGIFGPVETEQILSPLSQLRSSADSTGRERKPVQTAGAPPATTEMRRTRKKTMLASHAPSAGGTLPWRASETPIRVTE